MTDYAAIEATFSDFRIVRTRKVAQFVCEVPLEHADEALRRLGGLPVAADERWVILARYNKPSSTGAAPPAPADDPPPSERETRAPCDPIARPDHGGGTEAESAAATDRGSVARARPKGWGDRPSNRAARLCSEARFPEWIAKAYPNVMRYIVDVSDPNAPGSPASMAEQAMKVVLCIQRKRDLDNDPEAAQRFAILETEYLAAIGRIARP